MLLALALACQAPPANGPPLIVEPTTARVEVIVDAAPVTLSVMAADPDMDPLFIGWVGATGESPIIVQLNDAELWLSTAEISPLDVSDGDIVEAVVSDGESFETIRWDLVVP